ncbi:hypothetical protein DO021_19570 [Desulfobacter hydrogenophilus]|uniref:Transglutaminase n=1 Tax=Desulfobacter hydrogenophilus TaxID=2291 RepID=A0A328F704_9BACT|nr:transglutaminase-like cysteine peptidase [Desulfobacter hydrogenophilus]NDY73970.1 transglutaminase-like cysteine peptidase [Desulfobacter hydrogenophilus]QBH14316.1 hypothetical protein EYB58_16170 [Desulfobacter hydrogenophilus]RAM00318.1 hypothetical protein DO021_19570 [Desulfobacter hydrogenophilus]
MNFEDLEKIQRDVNWDITYQSDLEHYKKSDHWAIPADGLGDCEDYALLKRHLLLEAGWPKEKLRLATCYTETGGYHAVLIAILGATWTDETWWVLDNREKLPKSWRMMDHYKWDRMQDEKGVWRAVVS